MKKTTIIFIIFALAWQIAVGIIYGLSFSYNQDDFSKMQATKPPLYAYQYNGSPLNFQANTTQYPFPLIAVAFAIILLIVGLSMVAGYIEGSSIMGSAFTLLIFALTVQNFFIFRGFFNTIGVNGISSQNSLSSLSYSHINLINFGNSLQINSKLPSASFLDAIGASLAIYAGYTAVIGRISLSEIFFLSWIGTFLYQLNSQLLWRLYIPDNGYPSRAFAYGGMLGLVSSLILGNKQKTLRNKAYKSSYKTIAIAFTGIVFVWCSYPILVLTNVYTSITGKIVASSGQVNIWLALAASILGCYAASSLSYAKFCIHDLLFASISGAIAFSSSTDINYNPGAATGVGFITGIFTSYSHTYIKRRMNKNGVIDSNSVVSHFLIPSFMAAITSTSIEGVGQAIIVYYYTYFLSSSPSTEIYKGNYQADRQNTLQAGYQMAGWGLSIAFGALAGVLIGITYRLFNDTFISMEDYFNDKVLYDISKGSQRKYVDNKSEVDQQAKKV